MTHGREEHVMTKPFTTAAVVGAGTIGLSWAALFAAHGMTVRVTDPRPDLAEAVDEALTRRPGSWPPRAWTSHGLAERVHLADDVTEAVRDADVVQENGPENARLQAGTVRRPGPGGPRARAAAQLVLGDPRHGVHRGPSRTPSRILIGHPFNPPHLIPLVEVVPGERTSRGEPWPGGGVLPLRSAAPRSWNARRSPGSSATACRTRSAARPSTSSSRASSRPADLDTVMMNSLGLRWATVGPFLGAHLGGGPGGYRHMAEHIGKSMQKMWDSLGSPEQSPEQANGWSRPWRTPTAPAPTPTSARSATARQIAVLSAWDSATHLEKEN